MWRYIFIAVLAFILFIADAWSKEEQEVAGLILAGVMYAHILPHFNKLLDELHEKGVI